MKHCDLFGIIKFFKNEEYLNQLCGGKLFCNTPEFYRLHNEKGISDPFESCAWSYRRGRGDEPAKVVIDGHKIDGLSSVTFRSNGIKDSWLHCWTALAEPKDDIELLNLVNDLNRIRSEFGLNYAYIPPSKIKPFIDYIQSMTTHHVNAGMVSYSNKRTDWSPACKSTNYEYQREYRILIGECKELSVEPLVIESKTNFNDFIMRDIKIEITSKDGEWIWFGLNGCSEIIHDKSSNSIAQPATSADPVKVGGVTGKSCNRVR